MLKYAQSWRDQQPVEENQKEKTRYGAQWMFCALVLALWVVLVVMAIVLYVEVHHEIDKQSQPPLPVMLS